jgi:hypothetical protein
MKIIGGHDYYDCALSLGIDPTIKLLRGKSKRVPVKEAGGSLLLRELEERGGKPVYGAWTGSNFYCVAVVFCNKVYRGVMLKGKGVWSADKMREWARQVKGREVIVETRRQGLLGDGKMTLDQWFTPFDTPKVLWDWMIANKVSILVEEPPKYREDEREFQVNPFTLKRLDFVRALDPYTAFQELSMWIGGVLGGTSPEIVTIKDDKTLIEGHGFDNRFSFRGPRIA